MSHKTLHSTDIGGDFLPVNDGELRRPNVVPRSGTIRLVLELRGK